MIQPNMYLKLSNNFVDSTKTFCKLHKNVVISKKYFVVTKTVQLKALVPSSNRVWLDEQKFSLSNQNIF